jgi:hypothetical protein
MYVQFHAALANFVTLAPQIGLDSALSLMWPLLDQERFSR